MPAAMVPVCVSNQKARSQAARLAVGSLAIPALLSVPLLVSESGTRAGPAFVAAPAARGQPPAEALPRGGSQPREPAGGAGFAASSFACAGLAATAGVAAAAAARARGTVQRRAEAKKKDFGVSYNQTSVIPSGTTATVMTQEEEEAFVKKKCEDLEQLLPMTDEEFNDEVDELTWQWGRHLLPFTDLGRANLAAFKRRTVLRHKEFFKQFRLFKPLVLKYPTLARRLNTRDIVDMQDIQYRLNGDWIDNEEKVAGFTYEDLARETQGGTYEAWEMPKVGESVTGIVVDVNEKGAYLDVGAKAWAFVPLDLVSLVPISDAGEVLSLGQEVQGKIIAVGKGSRITGDPYAQQLIVSMTELASSAAWDNIDAIVRGEGDAEPLLDVTVMSMKTWGAVVMTDSGLEGLIPSLELADRAGDMSLIGTKIRVQIRTIRTELRGNQGPAVRPSDFALLLSYKNVATRELYEKLEEGQVVSVTVKALREISLDVVLDGVQVSIRKVDVCGKPGGWDIPDLFEVDEEIKAYVLSKLKETGEIRLSIRALERKPGELLDNKTGVFERAEKTAKLYKSRADKEKSRFENILADTLGEPLGAGPKASSSSGISGLDEELDSDDLSF